MKFWIGFVCPLLLVGACSSGHDANAETTADGGTGRTHDLKGQLYVEFRDDKHIINTDRGLVWVADGDTGCDTIWTALNAGQAPPSIEASWMDWRYDADMCAFAIGEPVAIPEHASGSRTTVAFVGYNVGSREPALFSCTHSDGTKTVQLYASVGDGFDPDQPERCVSVRDRCDGACFIDTGDW